MLGILVLVACSTTTETPKPPPAGAFDYQLGASYEPPDEISVIVRDHTASPEPGRYNICYVNAFQSQPGEAARWDGLLLRDDDGPVADPGWPDEFLLDTSTAKNRAEISERLGGPISDCAEAGFDAVEFDNLDSFTRSGGALTAEDNLALADLLLRAAHREGLAVAQKNAAEFTEFAAQLGFDFAIAEDCGRYGECADYSAAYDVVLDIEYSGEATFSALCASGELPPHAIRRDRLLAGPDSPDYTRQTCPEVATRE